MGIALDASSRILIFIFSTVTSEIRLFVKISQYIPLSIKHINLTSAFNTSLTAFIKRKYNNIAFEFISHTTVAKQVNEYEFFHKAESGGTYISSGLNLALKLIEEKHSPEVWNIYPVYASDGDNWSEDNERAIESVKKLCEVSNMFGYAELLPSTYSTTMYYRFNKEISDKKFVSVIVKEKKNLWDALKLMLSKELKEDE